MDIMPHDRVREAAPVQVYLDSATQDRLDRLVGNLGTSKSEVLRRGLLALERELTDPAGHPALRLAGIASESGESPYDVAREHDRFLSAVHEGEPVTRRRRGKGTRDG